MELSKDIYDVVEKIGQYHRSMLTEVANIEKAHGIDGSKGISFKEYLESDVIFADKPARRECVNYMTSLADDTLDIIEALMFFGRDAQDNPRDMSSREFHSFNDALSHAREVRGDKESRVAYMIAKAPLYEYLIDGLRAFKMTDSN